MTLSRWLRVVRHRVRAAVRPEALDRELASELAFHFDQVVQENLAAGAMPGDARLQARRVFGNPALLEEQCRDHRRVARLHDLRRDLVYGWRMLRKNPVVAAAAALSLAIGIGANAALLSAMDAMVRGRLTVPDPDRVVLLRTFPLGNPQHLSQASVPDYLAWQQRNHVFESMGAFLADQRDFGEQNGLPAERLLGEGVTPGLFPALRVRPLLGRLFTQDEDPIDNPAPVLVISHALWQRRFGGDPKILNREVRLNGIPATIIGVMPPDFEYPLEHLDYWAPMGYNHFQLEGSARLFTVTARLKTGVTVPQAQAEMDSIAAQLARDFPQRHRGWGVQVVPLRVAWFGWMTAPLLTLELAVGLVLLIACANVAGLLLARAAARRPEIAMRVALGAGPGRIFRQLLTESVLLSSLGGLLAAFLAIVVLRGLATITPPFASERIVNVGLNLHTLALVSVLSLATGIVFGVAPAWAAVKFNIANSLGESMRLAGSPRQRLRSALVAVQIACALVLLSGAGLVTRGFLRSVFQKLNFEPEGLLTFEFRVPLTTYLRGLGSDRGTPSFEVSPPSAILSQVHNRLRAMPGVAAVAGISLPPVNSILIPQIMVLPDGRLAPRTEAERDALRVHYFLVTPGIFKTLRAQLVEGREFSDSDSIATPWGAVINETMARRFWPGENPIGKRLLLYVISGERPREVIGVVRDIPLSLPQNAPEPVLYTSYLQQAPLYRGPNGNLFGALTFALRTSGDPMGLVPAVRQAVAAIDPDRTVTNITTMDQLTSAGMRNRWVYVVGVGVFAGIATLLAAIGIYGLMAYSVTQRTREIGVRLALGASSRQVLLLISRQALVLILAGLGFGLIGSFAITQVIASRLWGVDRLDPATLGAVTALLAGIALAASWIPACRGIKVDPAATLRSE